MPENGWLSEQLKTIRNLTEVSQILIDVGRNELLPTILETMLFEAQNVIEENCIVNMPDNQDTKIDYK